MNAFRNNSLRERWSAWAGVWLVCLSVNTVMRAQSLAPCPKITSINGFKVVLDDIRFSQSGGADTQDQMFMTRLQYMLDARFRDPQFKAVVVPLRCINRYPGDISTFDHDSLQWLNDNDVVLELWGDVLPNTPGRHEAYIRYVLVPVRFYADPAEVGAYTVPHEVPAATAPDRVLQLIGGGGELVGYALASLGVKQERNQKYDLAKTNLTQAELLLSRSFGKQPSAEQKTMLQYVHSQACAVVKQARSDPAYVAKQGFLALLPDNEVEKICAQ